VLTTSGAPCAITGIAKATAVSTASPRVDRARTDGNCTVREPESGDTRAFDAYFGESTHTLGGGFDTVGSP
jgi:hypothetical protein